MTALKPSLSALYRAAQFFAAVKAYFPAWAGGGLTAADESLVAALLVAPAQRRLFARMSPNDRHHAAAVARMLCQTGYNHPALLQAALLHDVAKSMGQPIIHRVLIVLLKAFWPAALRRLGEPSNHPSSFIPHPSSFLYWRRPFIIHAYHPAIGAAWAKEAGCDPVAVELIARHQDTLTSEPATEIDKLLALLQWADNLN